MNRNGVGENFINVNLFPMSKNQNENRERGRPPANRKDIDEDDDKRTKTRCIHLSIEEHDDVKRSPYNFQREQQAQKNGLRAYSQRLILLCSLSIKSEYTELFFLKA